MKKYKLSTQLIILFSSIIILATLLFSILVVSRIQYIYVTETLERLKTVIDVSRSSWDDSSIEKYSLEYYDMEVAYIRYIRSIPSETGEFETPIYHDKIEYSKNLGLFVKDQQDMNYIKSRIEKNLLKLGTNSQFHHKFKKSGEIFAAYEISKDGNIIILITNTAYSSHLRKSLSYQVILIFTVVLIFSSILIIGWSKSFSMRINRIKYHVAKLPETNYEQEYFDDGNDEVSDLSKSVELMRVQLKNTENDKREMLQNISHDFKTPLSVIKSYAEAINDGMSDEETANVIIEQARLLQSKVVKLLQYNRLEYLTKDEEFVDVNMKDVIESLLNTYKFQTEIKIETDLQDVYYKGYAENYYTVIDNIVDNAKRYAKSLIKITLNEECLTIYNDGEHIDEKFINGLFKPYEKGSKGQFGLGMSITKKTLDFFNYEIIVKNEEIGVTFIIRKKVRQIIHTL